MRKVIVSEFVTLDGVMKDPSWTFRFSSEEQQRFKFDELVAGDALLLGWLTTSSRRRWKSPLGGTIRRSSR